MRRALIGTFAVALLLMSASPSLASRERIDQCVISGSFVECVAEGKVRRPREIHLRLWSPRYDFQVDWVCASSGPGTNAGKAPSIQAEGGSTSPWRRATGTLDGAGYEPRSSGRFHQPKVGLRSSSSRRASRGTKGSPRGSVSP
jgi:hypothetical protein